MTDVLGQLEQVSERDLVVRRDDGTLVAIPREAYVTGKPVPPRRVGHARVTPEQLQRIASAGWPPRSQRPLGDWLLREAGGFTGRANSALIAGRPDRPVPLALGVVEDFYARHGLRPRAQVVIGSTGEAELQAAGWVVSRHASEGVLVQVASLARSRPRAASADDTRVSIDPEPSEDWLALYGRVGAADPRVVRAVLTGGDEVAFARIGRPALAIGRAVRSDDWVGLSAVEVSAEHRRRRLGRAVVDALLGWGMDTGATSAYLQVTADNDAAIRLYAGYGFVTHHRYRYLQPG